MKLICAPMATLSNEAFRHIVEAFGGCDEYYTEMINAGSLLTKGPFEKYYLYSGPVPQKIVWQLTGKDADHLAQAAAITADRGGIGIDLNMGCCAPEIYKSGAGIAWMCRPLSETQCMVSKVKHSMDQNINGKNMRLSVKLRLGDEDFTDDSFFSFCDMLYNEGVSQLTLHPRTRKEKYRKAPRWKYVERLTKYFDGRNMNIILNGAVNNISSACAAIKTAPDINGIMIARAVVQKPWIFKELQRSIALQQFRQNNVPEDYNENNLQSIKDLRNKFIFKKNEKETVIDLLAIALEYINLIQLYQPPEFWKTRLQRFFFYYCNNFSFAHYIQSKMLNATSIEEFRQRISDYFKEVPDDRYLTASFLSSFNHV